MPGVNISEMSDAEIAKLATRCLDALSLDKRIQAILGSLHDDSDREELAAWLEDEESAEG